MRCIPGSVCLSPSLFGLYVLCRRSKTGDHNTQNEMTTTTGAAIATTAERHAALFVTSLFLCVLVVQLLTMLPPPTHPVKRVFTSTVIAAIGVTAFAAVHNAVHTLAEVHLDPFLEEVIDTSIRRKIAIIALASGAGLFIGKCTDRMLHRLSAVTPTPNPMADVLGVAAGAGLLVAAVDVRNGIVK